ncbi:MAG: hypothetical protein LBE31_10850, partial [Deltaproteobacteria bacterium]|nr:hypothetical protein [Deltaproteobacteria bacterium]
MDFNKYQNQGPNYPFYVDALMFMGLILDYYSLSRKPIFYVTGNHEGYEAPHGISQRLSKDFHVKPGLPSDQNLTFYEAALLFGKKYSYLEAKADFKKENLSWAYRWITPWQDCLVNFGNNQNILLLGWGDAENLSANESDSGGTLTIAGSAFTDNQMGLLKQMVSQEDKFNAIASHFTYANFDLNIPFRNQEPEPDLEQAQTQVQAQTQAPYQAIERAPQPDRSNSHLLPAANTESGTFEGNRKAVFSQLAKGKVKLTISGHSHRGGAYTLLSDGPNTSPNYGISHGPSNNLSHGQVEGLGLAGPNMSQNVSLTDGGRALKSIVPDGQFGDRTACLVSGAGGLYSYQNINNSNHSDLDKPQGMLIKCSNSGNLEKIRYIRDDYSAKPRLAVRCDYLWYENNIQMFFHRPELRGDIVAERGLEPTRKYLMHLNPEWLEFLNGQKLQGGGVLPIEYLTLHCL